MVTESMRQGAAAAELREELTSPIHESQLLICTQTCLISIPLKGVICLGQSPMLRQPPPAHASIRLYQEGYKGRLRSPPLSFSLLPLSSFLFFFREMRG